jgi:uncharacterized repeat protein (TIGR03833 family)
MTGIAGECAECMLAQKRTCPTFARDGQLASKPEAMFMNGMSRVHIKPGVRVMVVQKQDQRSGKLTEGIVLNILTNSPTHPHGVKVRLTNGVVGRVKEILPDSLDPVRIPISKV